MEGTRLTVAIVLLGLCGAPAALAQNAGSPTASALELAPAVTFEVVNLHRMPDKGIMELRFAVANDGPADTSLADLGLAYPHQLKEIALIDFAGRKQYNIGFAGTCLCSTFSGADGGVVRAGERREFWAWYAAPPAGAKQMAIKLPDHQPIMDVALN